MQERVKIIILACSCSVCHIFLMQRCKEENYYIYWRDRSRNNKWKIIFAKGVASVGERRKTRLWKSHATFFPLIINIFYCSASFFYCSSHYEHLSFGFCFYPCSTFSKKNCSSLKSFSHANKTNFVTVNEKEFL